MRAAGSGGEDEVEDVRFVAELEVLDVTEVVTVHLVGERPVALDDEAGEIGADVELLALSDVAAEPERGARSAEQREQPERLERDRRETAVERRLRQQVE